MEIVGFQLASGAFGSWTSSVFVDKDEKVEQQVVDRERKSRPTQRSRAQGAFGTVQPGIGISSRSRWRNERERRSWQIRLLAINV